MSKKSPNFKSSAALSKSFPFFYLLNFRNAINRHLSVLHLLSLITRISRNKDIVKFRVKYTKYNVHV